MLSCLMSQSLYSQSLIIEKGDTSFLFTSDQTRTLIKAGRELLQKDTLIKSYLEEIKQLRSKSSKLSLTNSNQLNQIDLYSDLYESEKAINKSFNVALENTEMALSKAQRRNKILKWSLGLAVPVFAGLGGYAGYKIKNK